MHLQLVVATRHKHTHQAHTRRTTQRLNSTPLCMQALLWCPSTFPVNTKLSHEALLMLHQQLPQNRTKVRPSP
jgi:hypothetical protein